MTQVIEHSDPFSRWFFEFSKVNRTAAQGLVEALKLSATEEILGVVSAQGEVGAFARGAAFAKLELAQRLGRILDTK